MLTAAAFTLIMNIENPPRSGGFNIVEGFQTVELCEDQAKQLEKVYRSLVGTPNNFWFSHQCVQLKKSE